MPCEIAQLNDVTAGERSYLLNRMDSCSDRKFTKLIKKLVKVVL